MSDTIKGKEPRVFEVESKKLAMKIARLTDKKNRNPLRETELSMKIWQLISKHIPEVSELNTRFRCHHNTHGIVVTEMLEDE